MAKKVNRKIRMGMVGGGRGAFIGSVHRMAANLDGQIELVAGCFSADPKKSKLSGQDLLLDSSRVYSSYEEMAKTEAALPEGERIDFVTIVTRNNTHVAIASAFLQAGIHVVCEKPLAFTLAEARQLKRIADKSGLVFALTHNYTGYPMVKEARHLIQKGKIGDIIKVVAEYPQGYALADLEGPKENVGAINNWRMDPHVSGASNAMGDIGTHAAQLAYYMTGIKIKELSAELSTFIPGRPLDDDGNCLIRFENGAVGIIYASQVSSGEENNLNIRIYGTKGSMEWHQEYPNDLILKHHEKPRQVLRRGNDYLTNAAKDFTRLPFGHPEAFIEAFANIYLEVARAIRDRLEGKKPKAYDFPTVDDGVYGNAFIETVVKSSGSKQKWTKFPSV